MLPIALFKVQGRSMEPTMNQGDYLVVTKFFKTRALRSGFLVLVEHPSLGRIVKRIARVEPTGVWLKGDSVQSTSSASMGLLAFKNIEGRVRVVISPSGIKLAV